MQWQSRKVKGCRLLLAWTLNSSDALWNHSLLWRSYTHCVAFPINVCSFHTGNRSFTEFHWDFVTFCCCRIHLLLSDSCPSPVLHCPWVAQRTQACSLTVEVVLVVRKGVRGQNQCLKEQWCFYVYGFLEGAAVFTKLCRAPYNYGAQRRKWRQNRRTYLELSVQFFPNWLWHTVET